MSKSTILANYSQCLRWWYINNELPEDLIEDEDIIPFFTPCEGHYIQQNSDSEDCIDGVLPMVAFCPLCKDKPQLHMDYKNSGYSRPFSPTLIKTFNPLSTDWSIEEDEEIQQVRSEIIVENYELSDSAYSPRKGSSSSF